MKKKKNLLDVGSNRTAIKNVMKIKSFRSTSHGLYLHLLWHVCFLYHTLSFQHLLAPINYIQYTILCYIIMKSSLFGIMKWNKKSLLCLGSTARAQNLQNLLYFTYISNIYRYERVICITVQTFCRLQSFFSLFCLHVSISSQITSPYPSKQSFHRLPQHRRKIKTKTQYRKNQ